MKRIESLLCAILAALLFMSGTVHALPPAQSAPAWQTWNSDLFTKAQKEKKLVLLHLAAEWCHWCHVMEKETYSNKEVQALLSKSFIVVRANHEAYPDLTAQFEQYGWPATIIFDSEGTVLRARAGYVEAPQFVTLLKEVVAKPTPESDQSSPSLVSDKAAAGSLSKELKEKLVAKQYDNYDLVNGGIKGGHKFLDPDSIEYSLSKMTEKDSALVKATLSANEKLIDPVWGGVYQYSAKGTWDNPHFEKLLAIQAQNIRIYSLAALAFKEKRYSDIAEKIAAYVAEFLTSPEGTFYASQDADLIAGEHSAAYFALDNAARRAKGIPVVDKNIYTSKNGLMIEALVYLSIASGKTEYLEGAKKAAAWFTTHREFSGGGYRHMDKDNGGPYLADALYMGRALLSLYMATGEKPFLEQAMESGHFIKEHFTDFANFEKAVGIASLSPLAPAVIAAVPSMQENIDAVRFANLLGHYSGRKVFHGLAEVGMRYINDEKRATRNLVESGIVLADEELVHNPLHITVVGPRADPITQQLHNLATRYFSVYKRIDLWDRSEGPMINPDIEYPQIPKPAAFVCTDQRCSLPIFVPEKLAATVQAMTATANK